MQRLRNCFQKSIFKFDFFWNKFYFPIHSLSVGFIILVLHFFFSEEKDRLAVVKKGDTLHEIHWWEIYSSQLVHLNLDHLINNFMIIVTLGSIFEILHGPFPAFVVFWVAGSTGILFQIGWDDRNYRLLGASGGCYATIGAYVANFLMNWGQTPFKLFWLMLFMIDLVVGIIFYVNNIDEYRYQVAHLTHLGSFISGIFLGSLVVQNKVFEKFESVVLIISFVLFLSLLASAWYRIQIIDFS